jgi:hypothetical protein
MVGPLTALMLEHGNPPVKTSATSARLTLSAILISIRAKGGPMLKKHPRALAFIFFTEMWERVGVYTLMAILVL